MHYNSYPDLSFFLLDSNQGGLLGNTVDPAAEFPLKKIIPCKTALFTLFIDGNMGLKIKAGYSI